MRTEHTSFSFSHVSLPKRKGTMLSSSPCPWKAGIWAQCLEAAWNGGRECAKISAAWMDEKSTQRTSHLWKCFVEGQIRAHQDEATQFLGGSQSCVHGHCPALAESPQQDVLRGDVVLLLLMLNEGHDCTISEKIISPKSGKSTPPPLPSSSSSSSFSSFSRRDVDAGGQAGRNPLCSALFLMPSSSSGLSSESPKMSYHAGICNNTPCHEVHGG